MKSVVLACFILIILLLAGCTEENITNNYFYNTSLDSLWQKTNGPYMTQFWDIYATNNNYLFANELSSGNGKIFLSTDDGNNWSDLAINPDFMFVVVKDGRNGLIYILDNQKGLYKTSDNCKTWVKVSNSLIEPGAKKSFNYGSLAVARNGDIILGLGWQGNEDSTGYHDFVGEFYRSTDDGANWSLVKNGVDSLKKVFYIRQGKNGNLYAFQNIYKYTEDSYLLYSSDNGYNWIKPGNEEHSSTEGFFTNSTGSIFYFQSQTLKRSTDNGAAFTSLNNGLYGFIYSISISGNDRIFCGTNNGLYKSTDNGDSWLPVLENIGNITSVLCTNNGYVYFIKDNLVIYRSKKPNMF